MTCLHISARRCAEVMCWVGWDVALFCTAVDTAVGMFRPVRQLTRHPCASMFHAWHQGRELHRSIQASPPPLAPAESFWSQVPAYGWIAVGAWVVAE